MEYLTNTEELTIVADAIRTRKGTSENLSFPNGFASAVGSIPGGCASSVGLIRNSEIATASTPTISIQEV